MEFCSFLVGVIEFTLLLFSWRASHAGACSIGKNGYNNIRLWGISNSIATVLSHHFVLRICHILSRRPNGPARDWLHIANGVPSFCKCCWTIFDSECRWWHLCSVPPCTRTSLLHKPLVVRILQEPSLRHSHLNIVFWATQPSPILKNGGLSVCDKYIFCISLHIVLVGNAAIANFKIGGLSVCDMYILCISLLWRCYKFLETDSWRLAIPRNLHCRFLEIADCRFLEIWTCERFSGSYKSPPSLTNITQISF